MKIVVIIAALLVSTDAHAEAGDRWDGVMILEQAGAGTGCALLGGGALMLAGAGLGSLAASSKRDWGPPLAGAVIGGGLGAAGGLVLGVKLAGDARGGNGSWGATVVGTVGGGLTAVLTANLYVDRVPTYIAGAFITITLLAPPIVAYHVSTDENSNVEKRVMVPLILTSF
jgi:hypothetical protein